MKKMLLASVAALFLATGAAHTKPLTQKQIREYKALIGIGLTKKDAAQVARDPVVKKNEWGWSCDGGPDSKLIRVKGAGYKYKKNAVCE